MKNHQFGVLGNRFSGTIQHVIIFPHILHMFKVEHVYFAKQPVEGLHFEHCKHFACHLIKKLRQRHIITMVALFKTTGYFEAFSTRRLQSRRAKNSYVGSGCT